ncbi:MAG: TlpA disulfide reductase family protein [Polyangiaceae bacterium]
MWTRRSFLMLPPVAGLGALTAGTTSLALTGCAGTTGQMPPSLRHPLAGYPAPDFEARNALSSDTVSVPGPPDTTMVTVVDFWASWCEACVIAMPSLERLHRRHRDSGVQVVGISVDEEPRNALGTVMAYQTSFPIVLDPHGRIQSAYAVSKIPTTFVIDRNGLIRWVGRDPDTLDRAVARLLAITK